MQVNISNMQEADDEAPRKKTEHVRRTTIILEEDARKYIDKLIQDGKEAGIKQLISKMLDVYRSMMIYDWRYPGEYYAGISRVAFVNIEFVNTLLQYIPTEQHHEAGRKTGEATKISMDATLSLNTTAKEKWPEVFKRLRVYGLGDFYQKDKYIIVKTPYVNNHEMQRGYLETLLGITLETRTANPPFVYEIVP
jgi:hypothetical protein